MQAILLAFAYRQQYHALKAAAAAGYSVHVLGQGCAWGLRFSRDCASYHPFKYDPLSQPLDSALAEITDWAQRLKADVILPSDIVSTRLLSALAGRLPVKTCALPDPASFDMLNDKWRFYQFCHEQGIRVPETWLFQSKEELKAAVSSGAVPFPFIIKPHNSMGSSGVCRIKDASSLALLESVTYTPLLVQRMIVGEEVDISILANKGRVGAYAIQRNLPQKYAFIRQDALLDQAKRMAEASQFHGIAHVDAMIETSTGDSYLIECNPRVWYSLFASTLAGINFVKLSLDPDSLQPDNPRCIVDKEVPVSWSKLDLIKGFMRGSLSEIELNVLKYNLTDPVGKRLSRIPMFDDMSLPSSSPGSVAHQMAALDALSRLSEHK